MSGAVETLCSRGFLVATDGGDASIVIDDSRYIYTSQFWDDVGAGVGEPTRWGPDGEPIEWRVPTLSADEVVAVRVRIADLWTDLGAPRAWAEREADEALAWEKFIDMEQLGWLRA